MASSTATNIVYTTMYNPYSFKYKIISIKTKETGDTRGSPGGLGSTSMASVRYNTTPSWGPDDLSELSRWIAKRDEELKKRRAERITNALKDLM